jgi:DNA-3-methyladenine glycosylase II
MNVLSWQDLAIKRGIINLYGLDSLDKETFNELKERYSPYASVASLYLWEVAKNNG